MIEVKDKKDCCGCWACENACPKSCISMVEDHEGFRYPRVDKDVCIDCGLCEKVCPIINVKAETVKPQRGYLLQNKDERVLAESTSGGAFSAIASYVIEQGGVVFGAALNEDNEARHIFVESVDELLRFRNSKYVQCLIGGCYAKAKEFLKKGRLVCFSGTPCQIEGLLAYLRKPYENLITVDVVCRAVPSPKVLRKYIEWQTGRFGSEPSSLKFRDKQFYGYKYSNVSFKAGDKIYHAGIDTDAWLRSFFSGINVRPSCYSCRFKKRYRVSDITIWDCFEPYRFCSEMDNDKGVTRVIAHTAKGSSIMGTIKEYAVIKEYDANALVKGVVQMVQPAESNVRRDDFFTDLDKLPAEQLFKKYFPVTLKSRAEKLIRLTMLRLGLYKQLRIMVKKIVGEIKR